MLYRSLLDTGGCGARPLPHGLVTGSINVNLVVNVRYPVNRDPVMLALVVLRQLDPVITVHMIDDAELSLFRANDRHVRLNLAGIDGCSLLSHCHSYHLLPIGDVFHNVIRLVFEIGETLFRLPLCLVCLTLHFGIFVVRQVAEDFLALAFDFIEFAFEAVS